MLFFGARTPEELPYFGPLHEAAEGLHRHQPRVLAHARTAEALRAGPDARARATTSRRCSPSPDTHVYVCGLKSMEQGVLDALRAVCEQHGADWDARWRELKSEGRLHFETY